MFFSCFTDAVRLPAFNEGSKKQNYCKFYSVLFPSQFSFDRWHKSSNCFWYITQIDKSQNTNNKMFIFYFRFNLEIIKTITVAFRMYCPHTFISFFSFYCFLVFFISFFLFFFCVGHSCLFSTYTMFENQTRKFFL